MHRQTVLIWLSSSIAEYISLESSPCGSRIDSALSRTDDLRQSAREVSERGGELVAADEPAVVAKPSLGAIVVEDAHRNARLSDSAGTDEGNWSEEFCETDHLLNQLITSEEDPWWWWRRFPGCARCHVACILDLRGGYCSFSGTREGLDYVLHRFCHCFLPEFLTSPRHHAELRKQ